MGRTLYCSEKLTLQLIFSGDFLKRFFCSGTFRNTTQLKFIGWNICLSEHRWRSAIATHI